MLGLCMGFSFPAVAKCTSLAVAASATQLLEMCYHIVTGFYISLLSSPPLSIYHFGGKTLVVALQQGVTLYIAIHT